MVGMAARATLALLLCCGCHGFVQPQMGLFSVGRSKAASPLDAASEAVREERRKGFTYDPKTPLVKWRASKESAKRVTPGERSLERYVRLPPSEYSLLNPDTIERLNDEEFRCEPGRLNFFGTVVNPILYLRVDVDESVGGAKISLTKVELEGSEVVTSANGTFTCECSNIVSCADAPASKRGEATKSLTNSVEISVDLQVPNETFISPRVLQHGGSFVLQRMLDLAVPQFVRWLAKDYKKWSAGDDSRSAVASGEAEELISS
ncbi:unnamed protein product [Chrysoparadoxa australica]